MGYGLKENTGLSQVVRKGLPEAAASDQCPQGQEEACSGHTGEEHSGKWEEEHKGRESLACVAGEDHRRPSA